MIFKQWVRPSARPFSDEQAQYIMASAGLPAQEANLPEELDLIITMFFLSPHLLRTTNERLKLWRDARSAAIKLMRRNEALYTFEPALPAELEKFILRCDSEIEELGKWPPRRGRQRIKPGAVSSMASCLGRKFACLYGRRPTLSREGAFHRFVEAFVEAAKENLPRREARFIPTAGTVMKHAAKNRETAKIVAEAAAADETLRELSENYSWMRLGNRGTGKMAAREKAAADETLRGG